MWKRDILNMYSYGSMEIFIIFRIFQVMNESQWAIVISIIHSVECSQDSFWLFNFKLFIIKICVKRSCIGITLPTINDQTALQKKKKMKRTREKKPVKNTTWLWSGQNIKVWNGSIRHKFMWLKESRLRSGFFFASFMRQFVTESKLLRMILFGRLYRYHFWYWFGSAVYSNQIAR